MTQHAALTCNVEKRRLNDANAGVRWRDVHQRLRVIFVGLKYL